MSISVETKQELILASLRADVSIADLCRRAQVPESTFRDWRDRFIAAGTAALRQRSVQRRTLSLARCRG